MIRDLNTTITCTALIAETGDPGESVLQNNAARAPVVVEEARRTRKRVARVCVELLARKPRRVTGNMRWSGPHNVIVHKLFAAVLVFQDEPDIAVGGQARHNCDAHFASYRRDLTTSVRNT